MDVLKQRLVLVLRTCCVVNIEFEPIKGWHDQRRCCNELIVIICLIDLSCAMLDGIDIPYILPPAHISSSLPLQCISLQRLALTSDALEDTLSHIILMQDYSMYIFKSRSSSLRYATKLDFKEICSLKTIAEA